VKVHSFKILMIHWYKTWIQ